MANNSQQDGSGDQKLPWRQLLSYFFHIKFPCNPQKGANGHKEELPRVMEGIPASARFPFLGLVPPQQVKTELHRIFGKEIRIRLRTTGSRSSSCSSR